MPAITGTIHGTNNGTVTVSRSTVVKVVMAIMVIGLIAAYLLGKNSHPSPEQIHRELMKTLVTSTLDANVDGKTVERH